MAKPGVADKVEELLKSQLMRMLEKVSEVRVRAVFTVLSLSGGPQDLGLGHGRRGGSGLSLSFTLVGSPRGMA